MRPREWGGGQTETQRDALIEASIQGGEIDALTGARTGTNGGEEEEGGGKREEGGGGRRRGREEGGAAVAFEHTLETPVRT